MGGTADVFILGVVEGWVAGVFSAYRLGRLLAIVYLRKVAIRQEKWEMGKKPTSEDEIEIAPGMIKAKCVDAVVEILEWYFNDIECGFPNWQARSLATRIVVAVHSIETGKEPPPLP